MAFLANLFGKKKKQEEDVQTPETEELAPESAPEEPIPAEPVAAPDPAVETDPETPAPEAPAPATPEERNVEKKSFWARVKAGILKTKNAIFGGINNLLKKFVRIDEDLLDELEELLITADVGVETTEEILDRLDQLFNMFSLNCFR